jgi:putative salt-induced outer membrane protein YdiY
MPRPIVLYALAGAFLCPASLAALETVNSNLTFNTSEVLLQDAAPPAPPAEGEAAVPVPEEPKGFFKGWAFTVEAGLNGSSGNSDNFSMRAGATADRLTKAMETRLRFVYRYSEDNGEASENRVEFDARNAWLFENSRWRWFAQLRYEYDEFQDWNNRLSGFTGPGYELVKNEQTSIVLRGGIGGNQRWGGSDDGFTLEALAAIDLTHAFSERQKVYFTGELYPNLEDGGEFRAFVRAGWEILVDPELNMTLKLGIEEQYDSDPGGDADKSDFSYFMVLVFAF